MKRIVCAAALMLAACASFSAESEDAKLEAYFREHLEERFKMRPTEATSLGDHRFGHLLDDVSEPARRKWLEHSRAELKDLAKRVEYKKLTRAGQIDYEIFADELMRAIWIAENTEPFSRDPRVYGGYI